jgi:spore coat protein U-like protein
VQPQLKRLKAGLTASLLLLLVPVTWAAVDCSVSAAPMTFGQYDPDAGDLDSDSGQVSVFCRVISSAPPFGGLISYSISLSPGSSGNYALRRMQSGVNTLRYNLYISGLRSAAEVWGDGTSSTTVVPGSLTLQSTLGDSRTRDHIVYGRINGNQSTVAPGSYADSIMITLTF